MGNIPTQHPAERFGPDRAHCENLSGACCRFPELHGEDLMEIKGKPAIGKFAGFRIVYIGKVKPKSTQNVKMMALLLSKWDFLFSWKNTQDGR